MKKDKKLKIIVFILLTLLLLVFVIKMSPIYLQNDTLYDIKLGERYLKTGIFKIDDYSIHGGLVYQTHHFLVCIIDYLVYKSFSFKGLYVLEVILLSVIMSLFYIINKTLLKNKFLIFMLTIFPVFALYSFVSLRAQMYSYIIFLLEILFLEKYLNTNQKKYAIMLAILPFILINFHSGVISFYYIIIFTYILNYINIKIWKITNDKRMGKEQVKTIIFYSIIGLFLTLLNPYGINGLTYGLKTLNSYYITHYISEFQSINFSKPFSTLMVMYFGFHLVCMIFSKKEIKIHELLLLLGTSYMAYTSIRHFSILIIVSVILMPHAESLYRRFDSSNWSLLKSLEKGFIPMNVILAFFYLFTFSYLSFDIINRPKNQLPDDTYPIKATEYIKNYIPSNAHIFNQYFWGSYLMFNDIKVFVDSRCDLYNKEYNKNTTVFKDYINVIYNNLDYHYIINKYNIKYFFIEKNSSLAQKLIADPENQILYTDNISIIIEVL